MLAIDPDNAGALNNYGYFMACRGKDLPRARAMLERALALQRDEPAFLDSYAWILYLQGDYPAALQVIERALSLDDDPSAEVLEHYYRILEASGDARADQARRTTGQQKNRQRHCRIFPKCRFHRIALLFPIPDRLFGGLLGRLCGAPQGG